MLHESVAGRYADALFQAVKSKDRLDEVKQDLHRIAVLLKSNPDLDGVFSSPVIPTDVKKRIIGRIVGGRVGTEVRNLLFVMADKGRLPYVSAVESEYEKMLRQSKGILLARVETAVPIDELLKRKMAQSLADWKKKPVEMEIKVNPDLLGGVIVRIGDHLVDDSLRGHLMELDQKLQKRVSHIGKRSDPTC